MAETYTPFTWADGSSGGTPITAARLNSMEAGIESMDDRVTALEDETSAVSSSTKTASYTLALADANSVVEMNSNSGTNVTIPPNSSVAFPVGTTVEVVQLGTGTVTLVAGSGVTLRTPTGTLTLRARYSTAGLRKRGSDEWLITGDLS